MICGRPSSATSTACAHGRLDAGFNIVSAVWEGDGPAQRAGRQSPPSSAASLTMTASRSVEQQLTPEFAQALTGPITIFGGLHRE